MANKYITRRLVQAAVMFDHITNASTRLHGRSGLSGMTVRGRSQAAPCHIDVIVPVGLREYLKSQASVEYI